jgi:hypothetical protein
MVLRVFLTMLRFDSKGKIEDLGIDVAKISSNLEKKESESFFLF